MSNILITKFLYKIVSYGIAVNDGNVIGEMDLWLET